MSEVSTPNQTQGQGLSVAALVLGILSIVMSLVWVFGITLGVLAVIFGAISIRGRGRKKAIAGIVTGGVGVILSLLMALLAYIALPSLQASQRDAVRQNDTAILATDTLSYMSSNRGELPAASDLSTFGLAQITSIKDSGEPTTETAVFKAGTDCDGMQSSQTYSITVMLENGSAYCVD